MQKRAHDLLHLLCVLKLATIHTVNWVNFYTSGSLVIAKILLN